MRQALNDLILRCAQELGDGEEPPVPVTLGEDAPLYGGRGLLDSLQLVTLVIAVEEAVDDHFGVSITLADERALSRERSPFRTVGSFAEYVEERLRAA
jgi:D-alanine--poly(phosphoribitol) ligase subunit 2